jgi:hypothetical protein
MRARQRKKANVCAHYSQSNKEQTMNTANKITSPKDQQISVKIKLSALWASLMFLYIYADIFSLFRPGHLADMTAGRMGPFAVTQGSLLGFSVMMMIPAVMVFLSLALKHQVGRWANIILGVLYTFVNISNLVGETWAYYLLYGVFELVFTLLIVGHAWRWRNSANQR